MLKIYDFTPVEDYPNAWMHVDGTMFIGRDGQTLESVIEEAERPYVTPIGDYRAAIQSMIDAKAQEKQYDSGATLASYVNSTVTEWASQAQAFVAWRDVVWVYAFAELEKVQSGEREQPTVEEFLKELPVLEWATETNSES